MWVHIFVLLNWDGLGDKSNVASYVDEVQDLLIDTRRMFSWWSCLQWCPDAVIVIISLCRNPDSLLWAGDTAQTISIGSTVHLQATLERPSTDTKYVTS